MNPPHHGRAVRRTGPSRWGRSGLILLAVAGLALGSCAPREPANVRDPGRRAQDLIDAGNQAYRAGNYGLAARRYAAAAVVRKDDPAAYYGMGMALTKLGRDEEARRAYSRARELAQAGR